MIELTGLGSILSAIGIIYWLLGAYLFYLATTKASTHRGRVIWGAVVVTAFVFFPLKAWVEQYLYTLNHKSRLAKAEAIFNERCKTAGEKIYKTVDNVEGVLLMKLRTDSRFEYQGLEDPFGANGNSWGEDYIASFLAGRRQSGQIYWGWSNSAHEILKPSYAYVEAVDPKDKKRYRYTGGFKIVATESLHEPRVQEKLRLDPNYDPNTYKFVVDKVPATGPEPRYGVIFEDLTTPEERAQWVAGGSFKVIDWRALS